MKTVIENKEFKVVFNGSATYMIIDNNNDCWKTTDTERKALNYFNRVSKQCGI